MSSETSAKIRYLIHLKFPGADELLSVAGLSDEEVETLQPLMNEVEAYQAELEALQTSDLDFRIEVEEATVALEDKAAELVFEEQRRFFNLLSSMVDYGHWSKFPNWTLDQTVALLLGREPSIVTWEQVQSHLQVSDFAREYGRLRERLKAEPIEFPAVPAVALRQLVRSGIGAPPKLLSMVRKEAQQREKAPEATATAGMGPSVSHRISGGSSLNAANEALLEMYGTQMPAGVKSYGLAQVNVWLKTRNRSTVSESTCKRAWNALYGTQTKRSRPVDRL